MPMTDAFVSFNYFYRCSLFDLRFAKPRPFLAKTPLFADTSVAAAARLHAAVLPRPDEGEAPATIVFERRVRDQIF